MTELRVARRVKGLRRTLIRRLFEAAPADAIHLGLGEPDLPSPPEAALAAARAIEAGRTGYGPTAGELELRRTVASRHAAATDGPDSVVITVGSQEAMYLACLALADPGDEILYPDPGYPAYPVLAELIGARPVAYPLRAERCFRIDPEDVLRRLSPRSRVVILCNPSNPTGACANRDDLLELTGALADRGVAWLSDEIYSGFVYDRPFVSPAELAPGRGLVVGGVSKELSMTGWRIGWLIGPAAVVRSCVAAHQYLVTCASRVSQWAALGALSSSRATSAENLEIFRRRREIVLAELARIPRLSFDPPDGAFYCFVDVSAYGEAEELAWRILRKESVVTIPGSAFGENAPGHLRVSFTASDDELREGVRRIGAELTGTRS